MASSTPWSLALRQAVGSYTEVGMMGAKGTRKLTHNIQKTAAFGVHVWTSVYFTSGNVIHKPHTFKQSVTLALSESAPEATVEVGISDGSCKLR